MPQPCAEIAGLLSAIEGLLPAVDQRHAAIVLAATVRQLSAGIDFEELLVDDVPEGDRFETVVVEDFL